MKNKLTTVFVFCIFVLCGCDSVHTCKNINTGRITEVFMHGLPRCDEKYGWIEPTEDELREYKSSNEKSEKNIQKSLNLP